MIDRELCGKGAELGADPRAVLQFQGGEGVGRERVKYYLWDSDQLAMYKVRGCPLDNGILASQCLRPHSSFFFTWSKDYLRFERM
jgi:hypothetical protein